MIDYTPESFLKMARKRLCNRTEKNTRTVVENWVAEMQRSFIPLIEAIGKCAKPQCEFLYGHCPELKGCGKYKGDKE